MTDSLFTASSAARRILVTFFIMLLNLSSAHAFDKLSEAQSWIYERPHLSNTQDGQVVEYHYIAQDSNTAIVEDTATLKIIDTGEDNRRNVEVDFLSDERHLPLPPFTGYRGNPMIIAMLEHIAQNMGTQTGGGVLYFRNRIRDALASDLIKLTTSRTQYNDNKAGMTTLTFKPFVNDSYLKGNALLSNAEFTIDLSDDVPAGVIGIAVTAKHDNELFYRQLSVQ